MERCKLRDHHHHHHSSPIVHLPYCNHHRNHHNYHHPSSSPSPPSPSMITSSRCSLSAGLCVARGGMDKAWQLQPQGHQSPPLRVHCMHMSVGPFPQAHPRKTLLYCTMPRHCLRTKRHTHACPPAPARAPEAAAPARTPRLCQWGQPQALRPLRRPPPLTPPCRVELPHLPLARLVRLQLQRLGSQSPAAKPT